MYKIKCVLKYIIGVERQNLKHFFFQNETDLRNLFNDDRYSQNSKFTF